MVFSSLTFLLFFLPLTFLLYFLLPGKLKLLSLTVMSLIFYAWGEPIYVLLMIYSISLNYGMGRLMASHAEAKKQVLIFTVVINLLMLAVFKYTGFFIENINGFFGWRLRVPAISLPIGISFYTFQALSYIIDLYREKFPVQKDLVRFACYITMFPQLIAGPIVRYEDIERQLARPKVSMVNFGKGTMRFILGLAKKVLIANYIGAMFDMLHGQAAGSVLSAWLMTLAFAVQIYFDFSGYSDMAIGLGEMLGFEFMENFNYPYISASVTEFWRRWHISLGTWFREYVYIPMGGNRVSILKHIRNILVVWLLTGFWHGAGWNFIFWGLFYAVLLILDKYVVSRWKLPKGLAVLATFILVLLGWVLFYSDTLGSAFSVYGSMIGIRTPLSDQAGLYALSTYGLPLVLSLFFCLPVMKVLKGTIEKSVPGRVVIYIVMTGLFILTLAALITESYNPFLYFRF